MCALSVTLGCERHFFGAACEAHLQSAAKAIHYLHSPKSLHVHVTIHMH